MTKTTVDTRALYAVNTPSGLPFRLQKLGHIVLMVQDLHRSADFYTQLLGFKISDVYGPEMGQGGGMVFLRCNSDHHCLALVQGGADQERAARREFHHMAFEVATLDEVFRARDFLVEHGVDIVMQGRRRAGCQLEIEFVDPDGYTVEIYCLLDKVGENGWVRPASEWHGVLDSLEEAAANPVPGQDTTHFYAKRRP